MARGRDTLDFKVGTRSRGPGDYEGVVRKGGEVVWSCGHDHRNRDVSTHINGSALACVTSRVRAVRSEQLAKEALTAIRAAGRQNARLAVGQLMREEALAASERTAREYTRHVEGLAWLIRDEPVYGPNRQIIITPPPPKAPCPACGVELVATSWRTRPPLGWPEDKPWPDWTDWTPVQYTLSAGRPKCLGGTHHPEPTEATR